MDCFADDGIDNELQVRRMVESYDAFFDAYTGLSEPIQKWFDKAYSHEKLPMPVMIVHVGTSVDCLAEVLGVDA